MIYVMICYDKLKQLTLRDYYRFFLCSVGWGVQNKNKIPHKWVPSADRGKPGKWRRGGVASGSSLEWKWNTLPLPGLWRAASRSCTEHQALEHPDAIRERCQAMSLNGRKHPPFRPPIHTPTHTQWAAQWVARAQTRRGTNVRVQYHNIFLYVMSELKMVPFVTYRCQLLLIHPELWQNMLINMFSVIINSLPY